jgi:LmbE family N-acetylglucosaminyl deacetylase
VLRRVAAAVILVALCATSGRAQLRPVPEDEGTNGLALALRHLGTSGSVLYVTAHPDDENNGVLVLLNRGRGLDTSLLTLTRGDGGQNEIGPELFQALGVLRTEELAAIHRYDHADQYFSRAYEFGYSFSVEETFQKWGHDETLGDVVRVVRTVRPDVILTLPLESKGGGQHHQAAARLAVEAFRAAADPARFPEQIAAGLRPWQARKVYQGGVGGGTEMDKEQRTVSVDTSAYDPLLGMSANQFGTLARTNHKCQGSSQLLALPGTGKAAYELVDAEPKTTGREEDVLSGVDTSLGGLVRFASGQEAAAPFLAGDLRAIEDQARQAQAAYTAHEADRMRSALRAGLAGIVKELALVHASGLDAADQDELALRLGRKRRDFEGALTLAHRVQLEAMVDDGDVVPGQTFTVRAHAWNQGTEALGLEDVSLRVPAGWTAVRAAAPPARLEPGKDAEVVFAVTVGADAHPSQPYWHRNAKVDRYDVDAAADPSLPWTPPDVVAAVRYASGPADGAVRITVEAPAELRYQGRWVGGEKQKVVNVVPTLAVALTPDVAVMPLGAGGRREFRVVVTNEAKTASEAAVRLEVPSGWTVTPPEARVALRFEGEEVTSRFTVTSPATLKSGEYAVAAVAAEGGHEFREAVQVIAYDHIQERHMLRPAVSRVQGLDVKVAPAVSVGYVQSPGDQGAAALEQLGIRPTLLTADDLAYGDLSRFSTIVTGIRAYRSRPDLRANNQRLLDYARAGGHVVVQYNRAEFNRLADTAAAGSQPAGAPGAPPPVSPFAPYPASVTDERVTVEEAPIKVLVPTHSFFTTPNRIGPADFEGWVQERGLQFLGARDPHYVELLSSADPFPLNPGEKKGLLVDAPVGKGTWTYVGLNLWRQLPAGTPGAYRILANLISRQRVR